MAENKGGEDKGEWHENYDELNNERITLKEVFAWCKAHSKYEEPRQLWRALSRFAYLYGYWTDRTEWSDWLMEAAYQRGDQDFLAELKSAYAWLTLLREGSQNLQKAEKLLLSAYNLSKNADPHLRNTIIINLATLYSRKKDFRKSENYFRESMQCRSRSKGEIDNFRNTRLEIRFLFYYGEDFYRRKDYVRAKKLYNQVIKKTKYINWLRLKVKAYERLARIAILENHLEDAEDILNTWYPVTNRNHDYRRLAFFERNYADLEFRKGNYKLSKRWALQALDKFKDLRMLIRSNRMEYLIERCNAHIN
ncbi:hypothetical protein Lepto7375DRAFT_7451 [Leptolyngbya sp. PCC 7375]|nr:hypothetical protein Lepto7375DRAFT_7451 [Leptolyngbya sp. PCC 7375]